MTTIGQCAGVRRALSAALALGLAVGVAACGSSGSSSSSQPSGSGSSSGSGSASSGVANAEAAVKAAEAVPGFPGVPGAKPFNAKSLEGKNYKVLYLAADSELPGDVYTYQVLKQYLAKVGISNGLCATAGAPAQWASCVGEAITQHYNAIVMQGINPAIFGPSLSKAAAAHIPVIGVEDPTPPGHKAANLFSETYPPFVQGDKLETDWVIASSQGKAHVLIVDTPDVDTLGGVQMRTVKNMFAQDCPDCKVTVASVPSVDWATQMQTTVSSALQADPTINYVLSLYDDAYTFIRPALAATHHLTNTQTVGFNGGISWLNLMQKSPSQALQADVGQDFACFAAEAADNTLRALLKLKPESNTTGADNSDVLVPLRIFTPANAKSAGTPATYAQGYGSACPEYFEQKVWGLG